MAQFDACVAYVLKHEGGYTDNPNDPGSATNWGVSLRFLREVNSDTLKRIGIFGDVTTETIRDLTQDQAEKLYFSEFWMKAPYDKIMNGIIAKYIFDAAVNSGLSQAVKMVQRAACSAQKKKDYIKDDGLFGPSTLQAINQASFMLIPALISERTGFFRQLVAVNPKLHVFLDGWLSRCFDI